MPRGRPKGSAVPGGALERMIYEIGQRLGAALVRGMQQKVAQSKPASGRGPGRPRATASKGGCVVPSCSRAPLARGLCATHYRKARRLDMPETLSASHLNELRQDGRKSRFSRKAA